MNKFENVEVELMCSPFDDDFSLTISELCFVRVF